MVGLRLALAVLLLLTPAISGCQVFASVAYFFQPRQIQKPQYEFPAGSRVAMVIEAAAPQFESPVFNAALHERTVALLRDKNVKATFVPLREVVDLRRANSDFREWSLQRIGRELNADRVLYVRIDQLVLRETPEYPVITPAVTLRMKLIGTERPSVHARLWPEAKDGHIVQVTRPAAEAADSAPDTADIEARKLGLDAAFYVAMPFMEVDLEKKPPVER